MQVQKMQKLLRKTDCDQRSLVVNPEMLPFISDLMSLDNCWSILVSALISSLLLWETHFFFFIIR